MKDYKILVFTLSHNGENLIVTIQHIPHGERGTWLICLVWQARNFCERYCEVEIPLIIGDDPAFWKRYCYQYIRKMVCKALDTNVFPASCEWMLLFNDSCFTRDKWSNLSLYTEKTSIVVKSNSSVKGDEK